MVASHQCGPGSILKFGVICQLSLVVLYSALKGVSPGTPGTVESTSELLWFCITSISDWFRVLSPFLQPIRSETKPNRGLRVHIFPRFVSAT